MKLKTLVRACQIAQRKFAAGERHSEEILLVVPRDRPPSGENILLFGRFGPRSTWIANVQKQEDGSFEVVAYFSSSKILAFLEDHGE